MFPNQGILGFLGDIVRGENWDLDTRAAQIVTGSMHTFLTKDGVLAPSEIRSLPTFWDKTKRLICKCRARGERVGWSADSIMNLSTTGNMSGVPCTCMLHMGLDLEVVWETLWGSGGSMTRTNRYRGNYPKLAFWEHAF